MELCGHIAAVNVQIHHVLVATEPKDAGRTVALSGWFDQGRRSSIPGGRRGRHRWHEQVLRGRQPWLLAPNDL